MSFTRIPNQIIDFYMGKLTHAQFKVLIFIVRKTLGWNKKSDIISISQIQKMCFISRNTARDALIALDKLKLITIHKNTPIGKKDFFGGQFVLGVGVNSSPPRGSMVDPTKEILNKEERKKLQWKPHSF